MSFLRQFLLIVWVSPTTLPAACIGCLGLLFGTSVQRKGNTLEFHGGLVSWLLSKTPVNAAAITLGHVIWGRSTELLDDCRAHELVHVRQYERWGPLFLPMYLLFSLSNWAQRQHPYYDNPFEREAFGKDHPYYRKIRVDEP